jgi:hypothetical protein
MEILAGQRLLGVCAIVMAMGFGSNAVQGEAAPPVVVGLAKCSDCTRKNMNAEAAFKGSGHKHKTAMHRRDNNKQFGWLINYLSFTCHRSSGGRQVQEQQGGVREHGRGAVGQVRRL